MRQLCVEIKENKAKNTITGRLRIIEDDKQIHYIHNILPMTVNWVIVDLCRKLGFKDDYDCLETCLKYIYQKDLLMELRKQAPMFQIPLFCVNKYRKKLLDFKKGRKW